ncbi:MAG: HAD family hydrolase [Treponema sp.]|jgi:putative hydrolase of the HAD superfamily|nr:HAD family hydrolase [Treponema sp.]
MRNSIEGVAFDLDGTLYPNYRLHLKIIPAIMKELRLSIAFGRARSIIRREQEETAAVQSDFYQYQAGIVSKIMSVPADSLKEKINRFIYKAWESPFKTIKLFKGVVETITALRKAGLKLGLLSDFPPETKLEYLGLAGVWDAVLCSESFGAIKPHPLSFKKLAAALSLPPEKILYVGNSRSYDVAGAARAGMKTAWIKSPLFPGSGLKKPLPDFSFNNYRQLSDFVLD